MTTTVDSSQYAWFAHLGHKPTENPTGEGTVNIPLTLLIASALTSLHSFTFKSTLRLRATLEVLGERSRFLGTILILSPF